MKKIVFVQKAEGSYDPVMNFFNKKNTPSVNKTGSSFSKTNNLSKPLSDKKTLVGKPPQQQKTSVLKKQEISKVQQIEDLISKPKLYPSREDTLKSRDSGKGSVKKQSKLTPINKPSQKQVKEVPKSPEVKAQLREDSLQKNQQNEFPLHKGKNETQGKTAKGENLVKRIAQFQLRQEQYIRKIEQLQSKEEKYVKNEQKLSKLQKEMKTVVQKSRQADGVLQRLKDKDAQIRELMQGKSIPFNRKRQVILSNKIKQLKRVNRELTMRLKSYKGTDLVELSIQQNRQQIMKDLYTINVEQQLNQEMNTQMQSLLCQLSNKLHQYIDQKTKLKTHQMDWSQQQLTLVQICHLSEKISLNYLQKYEVCPLPNNNQQAISVYSILEEYKKINKMHEVIDKYHINLELSQQNADLLKHLQEGQQQIVRCKSETTRPQTKSSKQKNKSNNLVKIYERKANIAQTILIQHLYHHQLIRQWVEKSHSRLTQEISSIGTVLTQIKDIVEVGESAKESLYFYLANNLSQIQTKFPNLKLAIKQLKIQFGNLERLASSGPK